MSTSKENVINYGGPLPLSGALETDRWSSRGLPPSLKRGLLALGVIVLLASAASFAMGGWHVAQMPDSVGKELAPKAWDHHFFAQRKFSHIALVTLGAGLALIALARWERTVHVMRLFWLGVQHPMNLAIYRVVLFGTILFNLDDDCNRKVIEFFAGLPRELFVVPTGMEFILPYLPVTPHLASIALTLMNVFCITAMLGFFSRTSAALVILFGLYALGIPQFFGQTNHYHHMFWFAGILMASRCGDYLSIDAVIAARKRAAAGVTQPPPPSRAYSLPLRCVMVLLSLCYFFPGLWKYWVQGLGWAWSDNFKHLMEWKWINMGEQEFGVTFTPLFRLDHYPWMYKPSAQIALIFELGFVVLIFFPRAKYLAVMMGLGFHRMIAFMMRIPFYTLQTSYAAFFEWDKIFGWVGKRVYKQPLVLTYDSANLNASRSVATLRSLDLFGRVEYVDDAARAPGGVAGKLGDATQLTGAAALRAAAARNPLLWGVYPFWPILLPAPTSTDARRVATANAAAFLRRGVNYGVPSVVIAFVIIFTPNFFLGITRRYHGWPFACYPLFEKFRTHLKEEFEVRAFDADGNRIVWDEPAMMTQLSKPRYSTLCRRVRENKDPKQLQAFWKMLVDNNKPLESARTVVFVEKKMYSAPERWNEEPLETIRLGEAEVGPGGVVSKVKMSPTATAAAVATEAVEKD